jgi:hypothetical protein
MVWEEIQKKEKMRKYRMVKRPAMIISRRSRASSLA